MIELVLPLFEDALREVMLTEYDLLTTEVKGQTMYVRISTIEGDPGKIDDAVATINEKIIPTLKGMEGFTAINFLADRSSGS